jgi:hypothetical protein
MPDQNDIHGWGATKWGMTETEVMQLLRPEVIQLNPPIEYRNPTRLSTVGILEKVIGGRICDIHLLFDKKGGLNEVMIKPTSEKPFGYFESFFELLTQKYGPATLTNRDEEINTTDTVIWRFPSTVVELTRMDASLLDMLLVTVSYCPASSRDLSFL